LFDRIEGNFPIFYHDSKVVDACFFKMALGRFEVEQLIFEMLKYCVYNCPVEQNVVMCFVWHGDKEIVHIDEDVFWLAV
jgi:hypothetical protein